MNCNEIINIYIKSLSSYLSSEESALLNEHLKICSECRQALKWDSVITAALLKDEQTVPSENFIAEVYRQISNIKSPFKYRLYDFITSSLGTMIPVFIVTVLCIIFNTEIQTILLPKISVYYEQIIYSFKGYFNALPELKVPEKIPSLELKNLHSLVWIGFAGLVYLIVSLSLIIPSLSHKRR